MLDVENPGAGSAAHGANNVNSWTTKSTNEYIPNHYRDQPVVDLWGELRIALAGHDVVDDILQRHGVTDPAARAICGRAHIVRVGGRFFEFHPDGEPYIIVAVIDVDELVDLLAFDPSKPEKWWYRQGGERLLDGDALGDQLLGKPLHIFRSPLSWLKGRCAGVVIFDIERAFFDLRTAPNGIIGEDDTHTEELRRMMTDTAVRRLPRFLRRVSP